MNRKWLAVSTVALFLGPAGLASAYGAPPNGSSQGAPPSSAYTQDDHGWDTPPGEFREVQRKGYLDGVEGARKDFDNHRRPDVNNREEYRHPNVPRGDREDYRDGFRRGYEAGVAHLMLGAPPRQ
jgi:hypothetical protein